MAHVTMYIYISLREVDLSQSLTWHQGYGSSRSIFSLAKVVYQAHITMYLYITL
jgi:hypothetical protein